MSGTKLPGVRSYFTWACVVLVCLGAPPLCAAQQPPVSPAQGAGAHKPEELSDYLGFAFAGTAGVGFDTGSRHELSASGGMKVGAALVPAGHGRYRTLTLDLGYDRVRSYNGCSAEFSVMLPIVRHPKPQADERKNYLRIYGEPGLDYRFGGGPFGGYASAKVMLVVLG